MQKLIIILDCSKTIFLFKISMDTQRNNLKFLDNLVTRHQNVSQALF